MTIRRQKRVATLPASDYVIDIPNRMGGRAVEGTGLENRQAGNRLVGSNPTPSARMARRDIRDFFTKAAVALAQVNSDLRRYLEHGTIARNQPNPQAQVTANDALTEAHRACDRLRDLAARRDNLIGRLKP